jgi:hypothetical protein
VRRLVLLVVSAATALVIGSGAAFAAIRDTPDDTWMTNGTVYSIVRHGDYIYVGGKFTKVRSSPTGESFAVTNLARFHADSGVGDPTWRPAVTGADMTKVEVYELAVVGGNIWVGGEFGAVDGVARRNLAAVSPDTGAVDRSIDPVVGTSELSGVRVMLVSSNKVYLGGGFTAIDGKARRRLAALDFSGNLDPNWKPRADKQVRALGFSCDNQTIFVTGQFRNASGPDGVFSPREQVARFDTASGALHPWAIPAGTVPEADVGSDLAISCTPGLERITIPYLGKTNQMLSYRLDTGNTGTIAWRRGGGGNFQTVEMLGPDKLVVGGHFKHIDGPGLERTPRNRIALLTLSNGDPDPWNPGIMPRDGQTAVVGPWDLLVDENHLYIGGLFWKVAGLDQHCFTRFTFS